MKKLVLLFSIVCSFYACRQNSDVTTVVEEPVNVVEHFDFTLNGESFSIGNLSSWIEDHDTVVVTQMENFGTGELPFFIFNVHGTGEGDFQVADVTISLDEDLYEPNHFRCMGCAVVSQVSYFGDEGDFVIGTFEGTVSSGEDEDEMEWFDIQGSFAAIREN